MITLLLLLAIIISALIVVVVFGGVLILPVLDVVIAIAVIYLIVKLIRWLTKKDE